MINVVPIFFTKFPSFLSETWNGLLAQSFPPTFQYEFEWVSARTEYMRKDWKPFLLVVKEDEKIIGMFPLMYRNEMRRNLLPFRRVKFLAADQTDFSLILAEEKKIEKVVNKSMDWLFSNKLRWELLVLDDLVDGNPAVSSIREWLNRNKHSFEYEVHMGKYFYIDLARPWEEVIQGSSKKFIRRNVNWARNRISRSGYWEVVSDSDLSAEEITLRASLIHTKRQSELGRTSLYLDELTKKYIQSVIEKARSSKKMRTYWLRFKNKDIAYLIGFEQEDSFYAWNIAFDPDFACFSPSKLLFFEVIRDCHNRGLKEFNFMRGEGEYKSKWTRGFRGNFRFKIKNTGHLYGKIISKLDDYLSLTSRKIRYLTLR